MSTAGWVTKLAQRRSARSNPGLKSDAGDHRPPHLDVFERDGVNQKWIIFEDGEVSELTDFDTANEVIEFQLEGCTDGGGVQRIGNGNAFLRTKHLTS
jgi:hypothetical protein